MERKKEKKMTVAELKEMLEDFDDDMEVSIGMQQNYGSDFAYTILDPEEIEVKDWDGDSTDHVVLTMGRQFGTVRYED